MQKISQIAYKSLTSTGRSPRWWILALVQIIAFSVVGELGRPHWLRPVFVSWLVMGAAILGPLTAWLWLEIESSILKPLKTVAIKIFTQSCLTAGAIIFSSIGVVLFFRFLCQNWILLSLISSVIAATAILAMLYAVLCEQPFKNSLALTIDTWNKKTSLAAAAAFILILAHGVSYALVHGLLRNIHFISGFSVFGHSATILVLLLAAIFFAGFIGAYLNCFLVLLFLETLNREKSEESSKAEIAKLEALKVGL